MGLQNLERLVKTSMSTFVCVLEFDGMDTPQRAYPDSYAPHRCFYISLEFKGFNLGTLS